MKKILKAIPVLLITSVLANISVMAYGNRMQMYWDIPAIEINSKRVDLSHCALRHRGTTFVPVDDVLTACGFSLGWDGELSAVTAYRYGVLSYICVDSPVAWKGPLQYTSQKKTMIHNDVFYMPVDMLEFLTDDTITVSELNQEDRYMVRDMLEDTTVSDANRIYGDIFRYKDVSVVGNFGMMTEYPTNNMVESYTEAINMIGNTAPYGVNVYNILIPTSGEFYGPDGVYIDQTSFIKSVYGGLSQRIMPINAVRALNKHADENIYFGTDHHYTQRGAYWVYKEFIENKGEEVPYLEDFEVITGEFVGSLANFTKGTYGEEVLRANPDIIEKFIPIHYTDGAVYSDMYMKKYMYHLEAVYPNVNSYLAYIGGDNPLSVFTTDVGNGKKLLILKESFGNAFATWALNNYSEVYVVDVRQFNQNGEPFNLSDFYRFVKYDDLVIINSISSLGIARDLKRMIY